ncbi:MAG: UDP-N-acetylmuramate dehydrogenase [Rikenellaceae bacterium]
MKKISSNIDLSNLNSFGIKAKAKLFYAFDSEQSLKNLFLSHPEHTHSFRVLGGGGNILLTNEQDQLILHPVGTRIELLSDDIVYAQAGVDWDNLVLWCTERGLWGLENLSLIPGTVGAAPVQNIGAYGSEVGDNILSVDVFIPEKGESLTLSNKECEFKYRDSIFKNSLKGKAIITGVNFKLSTQAKPKLDYSGLKNKVEEKGSPSQENIRESVIEIREAKLPDPKILGNAGSFFKNPLVDISQAKALLIKYKDLPYYPTNDPKKVKLAAGYLIEQAGFKGKRKGDVGVHISQALVLVNYGKATGEEIMAFAGEIIEEIYRKFEVKIEMEVNVW